MYPPRLQPKRPILRAMKNPGIVCWGPAWDRSCKVCAPLPSGGETCSSFKVNDSHSPGGTMYRQHAGGGFTQAQPGYVPFANGVAGPRARVFFRT